MKTKTWPISKEDHAKMAEYQKKLRSRGLTVAETWARNHLKKTKLKWKSEARWGWRIYDFWSSVKGFAVKQSFEIDHISTGKSFSLFIESAKVDKAVKDGTIEAHEMTELNDIKIETLDILRKELSRLEKLRIAETIETLKGSDLYPYKGEPAGEIEKIERKVFDVCVTKVVQAIPNFASGSKEKQKIAYHLLRTSIESSPSSVQHIFEDILKLPETEIKQLSKILKKYSVAGLIQLAKLVADRRESIAAIEKLVFDAELKRHVLERKHLHKIIEKETWIFGEEFSLGTSDKSLSAVVESHKKLLNIKEDNVSYESSSGVTEKETIPDLVLARQYRLGAADKYHHLVIELKRPSVKIGKEEKMQIESYAGEVAEDSRFDKQKTKWTFIVVSSEIDPKVSKLFVNDDGLIAGQQDGNFSVYIKSWSSILQAAKGRMQHLWDKAQLEQPEDDGVQYLNEQYSDIFNDLKARKVDAESKSLLKEKKTCNNADAFR